MEKDNLLIITQTVDEEHPVLGFFVDWINEFSNYHNRIFVICQRKGAYTAKKNVKVLSLGKEKGASKVKRLFLFYKYLWDLRKYFDNVFVHMIPVYVAIGYPFWRFGRKRIFLWYAHGKVSKMLKVTERLCEAIFTSTPLGCRLKSKKVKIVGQGINLKQFHSNYIRKKSGKKHLKRQVNIVSVGRISPVKDYETLINAVELLVKEGIKVDAVVIGGADLEKEKEYLKRLKKLISGKGLQQAIKFIGPISHKSLGDYLENADIFVSTSHTGSLDKAILEALVCGIPVISCNEAANELLLGRYKELVYPKKDYWGLSERIKFIIGLDKKVLWLMLEKLRNTVVQEHDLKNLIERIEKVLG